jgi:hypothetical protein
MPVVPQVKVDDVSRKQLAHTPGERLPTGPDQKMKVVRHKGPCVDNEITIQA